ncbi:MAG: FHA domain-containing protein [Lachnospiraceae bacterium]|nr:FHA domain-containing protein [Lachnospiraceae bacterium]
MGDKRQLNRGFFLTSKIVCTVSAILALCMCLLGQIGDNGYSLGWIDFFSEADGDIFIFGLLVLMAMALFLIAGVLCSWLNIPVVSIIGFSLSSLANSIYWLLMLEFRFEYLYMGAWLFIVFCGCGLGFAIKQCVDYFKWKRNSYAQTNNYSGSVYEEPATAPLNDISVMPEPKQPKENISHSGTITGVNGSCAGYQLQLQSGEQVVIGKDAKMSNIVIDASYQAISRRHVGISYDAGRGKYCVTDYSSNGTFVNGNRLVKGKTVFIAPGSEIKLADDKNIFLLG